MNYQIEDRYTRDVLFECELPDDVPSGMETREALEAALRARVKLTDADLTGADLTGANLLGVNLEAADLTEAYLEGASLVGAELSEAKLNWADLTGANLTGARLEMTKLNRACLAGANLTGAKLFGANLTGASLIGANLTGADLTDADLTGANLKRANLTTANLAAADLTLIKSDLFDVLLRAPGEVSALRQALIDGRVNGSVHQGECAGLVGTIANACGTPHTSLPNGLVPKSSRPAERWFRGISPGDTTETSQVTAITVEWIDEFQRLIANAVAVATRGGAQ